jgi:hypothetical protein
MPLLVAGRGKVMRGNRRRNCALRHVILICTGSLLFASAGFAALANSEFRMSSDGSSVELTLRDISRREVLDRLFSDRGIRLDWMSPALADERISGNYTGSLSQVARRLLEKLNFILVYDTAVSASRITRVVIVGPAQDQPSPGLATLQAALSGAEKSKDNTVPSPTNLTTTSRAPAGPSLPSRNRNFTFTNTYNARSPAPVPIATSEPQPVPTARPAPPDLVPVPIVTGLPSVAPIAGARLPVLPPPVQSSDVRK